MDTRPITPDTLAASVIAVPPLARSATLSVERAENQRVIRHLEMGGVRTLLYGGNAVFGHVAISEYDELLSLLCESAADETLVIPSVGPAFGMMMDQATILRGFSFPTAMLLPTADPTTPAGIARGLRRFVDRFERPAVLYLKQERSVDVDTVRRMVQDGLISWVKYAIVRENPGHDPYLQALIDTIGPTCIVSGTGEQPAIVHLRDFGLAGFTSGCVCIAPRRSMDLLRAVRAGDDSTAERIRAQFQPLEALRDAISPVRVLHEAVQLAGIAAMGPLTPPLSLLDESQRLAARNATESLLATSG